MKISQLIFLSTFGGVSNAFFGDYCGAFKESCYSLCKESTFQSPSAPKCDTKAKAFECQCVNYFWLSKVDLSNQIIDKLRANLNFASDQVESLLISRLADHIPDLKSSNSTLAHPNGSPLFHTPIETACSKDYNYERCVIASITRLATSSQKFKFKRII